MALFRSLITRRTLGRLHGMVKSNGPLVALRLLSTKNDHAENKNKTDIIELKGKPWVLFASPPEVSLACAVSVDLEMHKGIAREFKKTFGSINELKEQNKVVGQTAVVNRNENSFVYHLLIKENWWDQGTEEAFHSSITAMKDHCLEHGVSELAIPRLGSGDEGVGWDAVKNILEKVFQDTGVNIKAYTKR